MPIILSAIYAFYFDDEVGYIFGGANSTLVTFIFVFLAIHLYKNKGKISLFDDQEEIKEGLELALFLLRKRASELKQTAAMFLALIMVLLITAGLTIVFASVITDVDKKSASSIENAIKNTKDSFESLQAAKKELDEFDGDANLPPQTKNIRIPKNRSDLTAIVNRQQSLYDFYSEKESRLLTEYQSSAELNAFEDKQFLSILTIRFGVTIIILFFVQVLVNLYRYNIRLAGYYDGKADALILSKDDLTDFEMISKNVSPDELHFGSTPNTPLEKIIDMAAKIGSGNKKT